MVDRNTEPELAWDDIQGDILIGLQKDAEWFIGFDIAPGKTQQFKQFLRGALSPLITSLRVTAQNEAQVQAHKQRGLPGKLDIVGVNVGFSFKGLNALGVANLDQIADAPFRSGLVADSPNLGDPTDPSAVGAPDSWRLGARDRQVDGILLIAGPDQTSIDRLRARIEQAAAGSLQIVYAEVGTTRRVFRGHEHFGFLDAVSQPGIRGQVGAGPGRHFLQASQNPNDAEQGLPGSDLLWPGEFVFGYPQQDETDIDRPGPIADGGLPFMKNGSFMAFRRLAQSVPEFDQFVETTADALGMDSALLGARLIGRWKSGAPLEIAPLQDDVNLASDPLENNDFEFDGDPKGRRCPFAAHIRKAYPRNDITALGQTRDESEADTQTHRVLRRGIPFGSEVGDAPVTVPSGSIPSTDPGRGLMFVCYQTSIEQQFQFIQKHWFNDPTFAPSGDNPGFDPILGQFPDQRPFQGAVPSYPTGDRGAQIALSQNFVVPTGGGYFFMPSLSALANVLSQ